MTYLWNTLYTINLRHTFLKATAMKFDLTSDVAAPVLLSLSVVTKFRVHNIARVRAMMSICN